MTTLENIQDTIEIKEVMDNALSNLYEGKAYDRTIDVFGKEVYVYTSEGRYDVEVIICSPSLDYSYVLDNSNSTQSNIIAELLK
jgi:hypothetical protein